VGNPYDYEDEDLIDDEDECEGAPDDGDARPGDCDHCMMQPGETIAPFGVHCWCWGGEGAPREECSCPWGLGAEIGQPVDIEEGAPEDEFRWQPREGGAS